MIDQEELVYMPQPRFLRQKPVLLLADHPLDQEIKKKEPFSSQSAGALFSALGKVGINRLNIHATYLFPFRPEAGDLNALFYQTGLPPSEYIHWPQSKKDFILKFALADLAHLRDIIKEVRPELIICTGRWGLYFLSGLTSYVDTKKTPFGTLLKWRASHLTLGEFWEYDKPHILLPLMPPMAVHSIPEYAIVLQQDFQRAGALGTAAIKGNISEYLVDFSKHEFLIKPTFAQAKEFLVTELLRLEEGSAEYAIDVETVSGFHDCIGIAPSAKKCICIAWSSKTTPHVYTEQEEVELVLLLRQFLCHRNLRVIGQNYGYDSQYLERDLVVHNYATDDTMLAQHVLFCGMEKNLAFLASLYCKIYRFWKDENSAKATSEERWFYNCKDCCNTFEIFQEQKKLLALSPQNIQRAYRNQVDRTQRSLLKVMRKGLRVKTEEQHKLYLEFVALMAEIRQELDFMIGEPFNPGSTPNKKAFFYDLLGLPPIYDPKTKKLTLSGPALQSLQEKYPIIRPFSERVIEFGNLKTFSSTFLKALTDIDGRMRCSYNPGGTDTYRLSSSKNVFGSGLNLQNVSKGGHTLTGKPLPNCRALFPPDPGKLYFDLDLDSADLRIVAARSRAYRIQEMFDAGLKPYVEAMKEYYHDPAKNKYSEEYKTFKGCIHALDYVGSSRGIADRMGLLVHDVDRIAKWWFGMNPQIKAWHEDLEKQVFRRGWIENIFGYRRYFWNKKEPTLIQIAAAWEPQSTVGLLINEGMNTVIETYDPDILLNPPIEILLQVHDSLAGQVDEDKPELITWLKSVCEIELPFDIPITIPVDVKTSAISWGDCG